MQAEFNLHKLSDEKLENILLMSETATNIYIHTLIEKHYPQVEVNSDTYTSLKIGYKSSFVLERYYRTNLTVQRGFTAVYTRTGLIRNIINDIYYTEDDLITH